MARRAGIPLIGTVNESESDSGPRLPPRTVGSEDTDHAKLRTRTPKRYRKAHRQSTNRQGVPRLSRVWSCANGRCSRTRRTPVLYRLVGLLRHRHRGTTMSYEPDGREPVDCLDLEDRPEPPTERSDGWDERFILEDYYEGRADARSTDRNQQTEQNHKLSEAHP